MIKAKRKPEPAPYIATKTVEGGWWGNRAQNPFAW